jgi:hypothetical protein
MHMMCHVKVGSLTILLAEFGEHRILHSQAYYEHSTMACPPIPLLVS